VKSKKRIFVEQRQRHGRENGARGLRGTPESLPAEGVCPQTGAACATTAIASATSHVQLNLVPANSRIFFSERLVPAST
jgi:hypothetical protein